MVYEHLFKAVFISIAPPTFTEPPPPVLEALVRSHISLSCMANGNPTPAITWFKDGIAIQKNISEVCIF